MNNFLTDAQKWLAELGIRTQVGSGYLGVNRTDMVALFGADEDKSYKEVLTGLQDAMNTKRLFWSGKDDDWLYLETI